MSRLSIVIAFILGGIFSPGEKILDVFFSKPSIKAMSLLEQTLLLPIFHYMIPALVIYLTFRLLKIDIQLAFNKTIYSMFNIAIFLYIFYMVIRGFAATIPGGGVSYAVISMSPLIILPAWFLMISALGLLFYKSFKRSNEVKIWTPISKKERIILIILFLLPFILLVSMFIRPNGALRLSYESQKVFDEECKLAGESIQIYPKNVKGVFLESAGGSYYEKINANNEYNAEGGGVWGQFLYDDKIKFIEILNNDKYKYKYYDVGHKDGYDSNELNSNYGVLWKNITNENMKKTGIFGTTITVINFENNQTIASTTYFRSKILRKICGHTVDGNFRERDFIIKVFSKVN